MRHIDPQQRFAEHGTGAEASWRDAILRGLEKNPSYFFSRTSPVQLDYGYEKADVAAVSHVAAIAGAADSGRPMVAYTLHVEALSPDTITAVSGLLVETHPSSRDLDVLKKLYALTGPDFWTTSECFAAPEVSPEAYVHHSDAAPATQNPFKPELPSLGDFLEDPENLGRKYSVERIVNGCSVRCEARIIPEENVVRFDVFRADSEDEVSWQATHSWMVQGKLPRRAPLSDIEADLVSIAHRSLAHFEAHGHPEPQKHETPLVESHVMPLESDHVILSSGASVNLVVSHGQVVLAIGSRALDPHTLQNPHATVCKWTFKTPSDQVKRLLYPELSRVMLVLSQEHSKTAVHNAFQRLLTMGADTEEVTPAPLSAVLHPSLKAHLKSIEGIRLSKLGPSFYGVEDFENVLRGAHRLSFHLTKSPSLRAYPQIFHRMGVLVNPDGSLELLLQNRLHNSIKASFSARTARPTAANVEKDPGSHILAIACSALTRQLADGTPCSQARQQLLETLHNFQKRDPQCNVTKELGAGRLPSAMDARGHALVDSVAAPLIRHYVATSRDKYTDSHAITTGTGELVIRIGDKFHPYQLSVLTMDNAVSGVTVTPRFRTPEGEIFLKHGKAHHYSCNLPIGPVAEAQGSIDILKDIVSEFWRLVDPGASGRAPSSNRFRSSTLRKLLDDNSGLFKRL